MYKQTARLSPTEVLQLEWEDHYANFRIYLHGQLVASFPDKASLKLGNRFALPGDEPREINVLLADGGVEIWHNGMDLRSGLKSGETDHFTNAANYLIGYGLVQLIFGLLVVNMENQIMEIKIAAGGIVVLAAAVLIGSGIWAKKTSRTLPLSISIGLLSLMLVLSLSAGRFTGGILTVLMIYYLYKGIRTGPVNKPENPDYGEDGPLDVGL